MAAPVLLAPDERLFGSEIVGRHQAPFVSIGRFERPPPPDPYGQPVTDLPGELFARALGSGVSAYNALVLASFPLAALFAFLLASRLTGSRVAAWVAGLAYAFAPYHVAQSAYHVHGAQAQWLPLYLLALWQSCERASPGRIALLVVAGPLVALSSFYYGLMAAVIAPVALVGYYWFVVRRAGRPSGRSVAVTAGVVGAQAGAGVVYILRRAPAVLEAPGSLGFPRGDLELYSARWWSYLLPPVEHPLFGAWSRRVWEERRLGGLLEQQITVGLGLLLLAAVGVWAASRWGSSEERRAAALWLLVIGVVAFAFSLAPDWGVGGLTVAGPSGWLHELLPMFRAYGRFGVVVLLATATLAGLGAAALLRGPPRWRAAAGVLIAVAAVELTPLPPWRWRDVLPTSAHRWLEKSVPSARVLDCASRADPAQGSLLPLFDGDLTLLEPDGDCGQPGIAGVVAGGAYTHLLVRGDTPLGRWMAGLPAPRGLEPVGDFDDALLYEVESAPPPVSIAFGDGFHWREYKGKRTYRWMGERGELTISQADLPEEPRSLVLVMSAFPATRTVDVLLDGQPIAELQVRESLTSHRLGPLDLTLGPHALTLESRNGATVADDVLKNGDLRALSVAVWDWKWVP